MGRETEYLTLSVECILSPSWKSKEKSNDWVIFSF